MSEPDRSELIALGAGSAVIRPTWVRCASFPRPSTNNDEVTAAKPYHVVARWAREDPRLARLLLKDLIDSYSVPVSTLGRGELLTDRYLEWQANDTRIITGWERDPNVLAYLKLKNCPPPVTKPSTAPVSN